MKHIFFGIALAASTMSANAALVFSNPLQTTEILQTGTLDKFDSSLGTLTSVTLSWNAQAQTNISLSNNAAQAQNVRATSIVDVVFSSATDAAINNILSSISLSMAANSGGIVNIQPGQTLTFGPITDSDSASATSSLAAVLAAFTGPGTFDVTCESLSGLTIQGGGGNVVASQSTQAACGASVNYVFTALPPPPPPGVPAPGTLVLLGLGCFALASRRGAKK